MWTVIKKPAGGPGRRQKRRHEGARHPERVRPGTIFQSLKGRQEAAEPPALTRKGEVRTMEKATVKADCFGYRPGRKCCNILTELVCEKRRCSFYLTREEYIRNRKKYPIEKA